MYISFVFCFVASCFNNIVLTGQIVEEEVASVAVRRILIMILFLDIFLVFAPRIRGVLQTFIGC